MMFTRLGLLSALLLLLSSCGTALIDEDFDEISELPAYIEPSEATAAVGEDGILRVVKSESTRGESGAVLLTLPDEASPRDNYSVEARLRVISGTARLWARTDADLCRGYALTLNPGSDNYSMGIAQDDCTLDAFDTSTRLRVDFREWHTLRLDVEGETIRGFVDGVEFFSAEDATYTDGIVALEIVADLNGAHLEIDSVSVR